LGAADSSSAIPWVVGAAHSAQVRIPFPTLDFLPFVAHAAHLWLLPLPAASSRDATRRYTGKLGRDLLPVAIKGGFVLRPPLSFDELFRFLVIRITRGKHIIAVHTRAALEYVAIIPIHFAVA
jgi:hypothetical protein